MPALERITEALDTCVRQGRSAASSGSQVCSAVLEQCGDSDPSDVVEVAARELLSLALERRDEAYAAQLVDVCVAYALCEVDRYTRFGDCSVVVLCVPFKLLEDALDASSVAGCEFWWAQVERSCDALTHASLFQRGKFVLLRLCNSLLRRLSRTRHAELCGRVLLFLAAAWPISEKSAVNLKGDVHLENVTTFEDKAGFETAQAEEMALSMDCTETATNENVLAHDYATYSAFWAVQKWLSDPNLALRGVEERRALLANMDACCAALENTAPSEDSVKRARDTWLAERVRSAKKDACGSSIQSADISGTMQLGIVTMGAKYLTNSRLLRIQLRDPVLRMQLVTQLYLVFDYLRRETAIGNKPSPGAEFLSKPDWALPVLLRVRKLIIATPPNGPERLKSLEEVIEREVNWSTWKRLGCAPYERPSQSKEQQYAEKRKRERYSPPVPVILFKRTKLKAGAKLDARENEGTMKDCCARLADAVPSIEAFLEAYEIAEDPENSIEEEYHPKHDKVYCWRALRLVVANHLTWFAEMHKADLDVAVKKLQAKRVKTNSPKILNNPEPTTSTTTS